ncbi:MAG: hypothetical protein ACFFCY_03260 [Promethearchaeota archaeon]
MRYDENNVTQRHQKVAQKAIDNVTDGFELEEPPNYTIKGLNPYEEIAKLEYQKLNKDEKEIKKIEKQIKFAQNYTSNFVKVIFDFNNHLKKLIYKSDMLETKTSFIPIHIWCGVLDFPITSSVIFGRVCNRKRHKGGNYYFAPFEKKKHELLDRLEKLEEKLPDIFPYEIIESNLFLDLIRYIKFSEETREELKQIVRLIHSNNLSNQFVANLNQKKELIKKMKKIPHFGTTEYLFTKFVSDVDVSTVLLPYKAVTYFHIDQFVHPPKKLCRAIYSLINVLEKLNL